MDDLFELHVAREGADVYWASPVRLKSFFVSPNFSLF